MADQEHGPGPGGAGPAREEPWRIGLDPEPARGPTGAPSAAPPATIPTTPAFAPLGGHEQVVLSIGDVGVSRSWIVTPNGTAPLRGSQWVVQDMSITTKRIPAYAIVLAVIFALACLLGLLFLLITERTTSGYANVSVRSGDLQHTTQIPVWNPVTVAQVRQAVAQAQSMAAAAPAVS